MLNRKPNKIVEKFRKGENSYGMQMYLPSPELYELIGWAGYDFLMIDMEHTRMDYAKMTELIRVAEMTDTTAFVRVPANEPKYIRYALEAGARGVIVPHIKSGDDVKNAQAALRFPPEGRAGICPAVRAAKYAQPNWEQYMKDSNENTSLVVLFEDVEAIEDVDAILAELQPGRDGYGMGNADISHALYKDASQPVNWQHPYVKEAAGIIIPKAKARGVFNLGMAWPNPDKAGIENARSGGTDAIMFHPDVDLFSRMLNSIMKDCKDA